MSDKPEKPLGLSSIARMAGNIAAGILSRDPLGARSDETIAKHSVRIARAIAKELEKS